MLHLHMALKSGLHDSKCRASSSFVGQRPPPTELRDGSQPSCLLGATSVRPDSTFLMALLLLSLVAPVFEKCLEREINC
ncbi:hypothetical protein F2Q69_00003772 [Brassica cretica]|uniref:Uncharacterized protein n=1 Tax=Brassica cretica TaxID=69181 RepID=A0A8S9PD07_BRACR|nr:hypothetical protein F2Q69_00003772 [Brassica cretica]